MVNDEWSGTIQSDQKLLNIIEAIAKNGTIGVSQLAQSLEMSKSSVHKHLKTLRKNGYVVNHDGNYQLSLQFLSLGMQVRETNELLMAAWPQLLQCTERTDETVTFSVLEDKEGVYMYTDNSMDLVPVGKRFDLHENGAGKVMLAELADEAITEVIEYSGLAAQTKNTITDRTELWNRIELIRERGYALNLEERRTGIQAVSVAINHPNTESLAALSISGPANRLTEEKLTGEYADVAISFANEIKDRLRYSD